MVSSSSANAAIAQLVSSDHSCKLLSDGPGRLGFELLNYNDNLGRRQRGVFVCFKGKFLRLDSVLDLQIVLVSSLFFCFVFFAFFVVN
jgi:hypothetical protein